MRRAALICLAGLALVRCGGSDDGATIPGAPSQMRCLDWDGGREYVVVELPIDGEEARRMKLCLLNAAERTRYGKTRRCYFDCPPELRDFQEPH